MKPKPINPSDAWAKELQPFLDFAKDHYGFQGEVKRQLERLTGRSWNSQQVYEYMAPQNRVEPRAGLGIVLLRACAKAKEEMEAKKDLPTYVHLKVKEALAEPDWKVPDTGAIPRRLIKR